MADQVVQDIIEEIPIIKKEDDSLFIDMTVEEFSDDDFNEEDFDDDDDAYIQVDDIGHSVERIVDVLGGIFVNAEGSTITDILTRIAENIEKHNEIIDKNNKVLYKLSKVIEDFSKK